MSQPPQDPLLDKYAIGLKLKTLRSAKRLTLTRLASEIGLSTALLSKLETGQMVPTLHTLTRLCKVYGVGLGSFFSDATYQSLAITRRAHMLENGRVQPTATRIPLHVPTAQSRMVARIFDLPPGLTSTVNESGTETEVFAYVLDGRLRLTLGGLDEVLETGDCAALSCDELVAWSALGKSSCRVLTVSARTPK